MALQRVTTLAESNGAQPWLGAYPQYPECSLLVEIDGWQLTLFNDWDTLATSTADRLMAESEHLGYATVTEPILLNC